MTVRRWAAAGWTVGVAAMVSYFLTWLTILVLGHPPSAHAAALYAVLGGLAVTASVFRIVRGRVGSDDWSRLPAFALGALVLWLLAIGSAGLLATVTAASAPLGVLYSIVAAVLVGAGLAPLLLWLARGAAAGSWGAGCVGMSPGSAGASWCWSPGWWSSGGSSPTRD